MSAESELSESCEADLGAIDYEYMYKDAQEYIGKLERQLKEKHAEVEVHVRRWQFYENLVKRLTSFN